MTQSKRQYRELSPETKQRISQSMQALPPRSMEWRQHISDAMVDYWKTIPHKPTDEGEDGESDSLE